ncbi:DUF2993 domain-containing protein [Streptomyces sp. B6B3]|uniref:LmeA family phospholipid-binding protein n=1 Tax=Streptomyces sp. B6B3 TaxID=3153570 RepID=UPI00325D4385
MRALRISLIIFGVLVVLLIVADRVAVWVAEGEVASKARDSLGLSEEPSVSIEGFPFLTQMAGQHLDKVQLGVDSYQAQVDGQSITLHDLDIEVRDTELEGFSSAVASEADGTGLIDYEEMTRAYGELLGSEANGFGATFEYAGDNLLRVNLQAAVMGQNVDVGDVTGELVVEGDQVRMEIIEENVPDSIPGGDAMVEDQLGQGRTISGLPDGLELESLVPGEDGVTVHIRGTDVGLG